LDSLFRGIFKRLQIPPRPPFTKGGACKTVKQIIKRLFAEIPGSHGVSYEDKACRWDKGMADPIEIFTIEIDDAGNVTINGGDGRLRFTPVQALMVLDILKSEEDNLKRLAEETSPIGNQMID
jgi:hypothetical protein